MELYAYIKELCQKAKDANSALALSSLDKRNALLERIAAELIKRSDEIIKANEADLALADEKGLSTAMKDRLKLSAERINAIAASVKKLIALPDPLGRSEGFTRPNGLYIERVSVPLGNIGIIYEARPNVTVDAAVLCLKSGNCAILRGGKEAYNTNVALEGAIKSALSEEGFSPDLASLIHDTSREGADIMMGLHGYIDVLIPRGSANLINSVVEKAKVPVIETGAGNCHVYVDEFADMACALKVALSAKISRPSVCNAAEKLLVHKSIADGFLPEIVRLYKENGVLVKGDEKVRAICPDVECAEEDDLTREYNDYVITVYVKDSIDDAIAHINKYNTGHSEAIITKDLDTARKFQDGVNAAAVYVNASTRFTDGEEFGFGAEIGISTQKLHARGPLGPNALTTVKYKIFGNGQIR